ncbi:hypothetical protein [Kribbella antibiotica]|uniref:hypothetical protein n=1 Tax=Kribbella antibiotica TaxID=190195 RepID=UPI00192E1F67|nr:hypothetical protein [Kribbella antibiotica]
MSIMRVAMSGRAWVSYGQIYVESTPFSGVMEDSFRGQRNGLCGAASAGVLFLVTGLHTGEVGFTVEVHGTAPPLDDSWEEIVEASYRPAGEAMLITWGGDGGWWPLELAEADYRVRYCGWGMDAGHQANPPSDDEPVVDRYLLQFWPAAPAADRVVKVTSANATYWHDAMSNLPPPLPPPPPLTAEQFAAAQAEQDERMAEQIRRQQLASWGGSLPSDRIRGTRTAFHLVKFDRPLLDDLDRADDATLIAVARWSARQACAAAELDRMDWVADALDRMDQGVDQSEIIQPPPETFGTEGKFAVFSSTGWDAGNSKPIQAFLVIHRTYDEPLTAALSTLWMAIGAYGEWRGAELIAKLREAFPQLG